MPSVYEIITEKIIKQLESGVAPGASRGPAKLPQTCSRKKSIAASMSLLLPRRGSHHDSGLPSIRQRSWAGGFEGREVFARHLLERWRRARDDRSRRHERDLAAFSAPLLQRVQFVADGRHRHPRIPSAGDAHQRSHRNVRTNRDEHAEPASVRAIR